MRRIIEQCQNEAVRLLKQNYGSLERIATRLLEKENINGAEFMELLGRTSSN